MTLRTLSVAFFVCALGVTSFAQTIATSNLITSPDGSTADVQNLLIAAGKSTLVAQQSAARIFEPCDGSSVQFSILWQRAGLAPEHEVGYYLISSPATLVPVIGGSSTGLPSSASASIHGQFGLYLKAGGNTFYSEVARNGGDNQIAILANEVGGLPVDCSFIGSFEDLKGLGDHDYNDIGFQVEHAQAVPEPASMAVLGLGALGAMRRRKLAR